MIEPEGWTAEFKKCTFFNDSTAGEWMSRYDVTAPDGEVCRVVMWSSEDLMPDAALQEAFESWAIRAAMDTPR